ncbi:DUF58 domain-containing protein [Salinibacterium sp. PAMC 21357]|uniref:DUF58 domain-containing protein n=1 Tax=Salinibacterium sp. PAMC 21357 TaxID=1112215 RepID=UPI000289FD76|nr:DUF58 domain-containing protein [Salinibacterium sp. PAMC 21357]
MNNEVNGHTSTRAEHTGTWSRFGGATVTRHASTRVGVVGGGVAAGRRAFSVVVRTLAAASRWLRETVTAAGWLVLFALVGGAAVGFTFGMVEGWVVAAIAAVLLIAATPFLLGGATLAVRLEIDRDRVVAGSSVTAQLHMQNASVRIALPSIIDIPVGDGLVEVHVPLLLGKADHVETVAIAATKRGVISVGPMTIARGDPVGLLRREVSWPQVEHINVHPVTAVVPSTSAGFIRDIEGSSTKNIVDSDLAFHAIREYVTGDSPRHINWKSTAKTGKLMVRQYEETRRARIAVVLDVNITEFTDDDEFEMAVSAAASLSVQGITEGREVLVSLAAAQGRDGSLSIRTLPTISPRAFLDATSRIDSSDTAVRIEEVTKLTSQSFPELSIAFVLTGSQIPLDRLRLAAFAFPTNVRTVIIRCELGAEPTVKSTRDYTILTIGVLGDLGHLIARGALG